MTDFNQNQLIGLDKMNSWKMAENSPFFILTGKSGSGKSTLIKEFISNLPTGQVVLTAPTTEALENIAEDLPQYSAMTIHKLLGYRPTETHDEKQILVRAGAKRNKAGDWIDPPPKVVTYKWVILDEAYYNPGIMTDAIFNCYRHIKWLLVGDFKQLSPVEESQSRLLEYEDRVDFKHDLPDDMRSTCPIQKNLVSITREKGLRTDFSEFMLTKPQAMRKLISAYDGDPENFSFLALAYEHWMVDKVAADVRDIIYNYAPGTPPQPEEIIRTTGVVDSDGNEVVRTNERVKVIHWTPAMILVKRKNGEEVAVDLDHTGELETLYNLAKLSRLPTDWRIYHNRARQYVKIKSAFSTTVHSSQGRTESNTLIILDNVLKCRNDNLLYVGVGRSRNVPWFVNGW
jgi:energy-coupling factor transporter ATP-binding protein EcfA2